MPVKVIDLDLSKGLKPIWGMEGYDELRALVRYRSRPIGWIYPRGLNKSAVSTDCLAEAIKQQLGGQLLKTMLSDRSNGRADPTLAPISIIICVSDRTTQLERCLRESVALDYPDYEIVVVDCGRSVRLAPQPVHSLPIRYVREEQSSMAHARNRGVAEARHEIIAFIDADAQPDAHWLRAIGRVFAEPDVVAVTGAVASAELDTVAQWQFENGDYGTARGLRSRRFSRETMTDQELLWANGFGTGHNMAFRREIFRSVGSFSDAFDGNLPSDGSDIEMFHQLLVGHHTVVYEPAALVWYTPPRELHAMRGLAFQHGRAFGTYLRSCARNRTVSRLTLLRFVLRAWLGSRLLRRICRPGKATRRLPLAELRGGLASLLSFKNGRAGNRPIVLQSTISDAKPIPTPPRHTNGVDRNTEPIQRAARNGQIDVRVVRTWYPHWGEYSGINQFLKHIDKGKYHVETTLVQENDNDFPLHNTAVLRFLRYWGQRQDMAWYNLSDLRAEVGAVRHFLPRKADIIHYLDGEHSAQFLPRLHKLPRRARPQMVVSYHQPPEVLDEVIRKDNIPRHDCIIVVAPEQWEFFAALAKPERVRLILHGIDTDHFKPVMSRSEHETIRCITVGHNYRDYKTVRAVAERLRDDRRIEFCVVSPRPTGVEDLPNVSVYKGIDDDRLLELYQHADVLFLPLTKATANNALLEGMACGLPVLSTQLPSVKAYASGGEAILIEDNNIEQFVDAILHLADNPLTVRSMAVEARKRAEELDWRNITPQYEAIYSELSGKS